MNNPELIFRTKVRHPLATRLRRAGRMGRRRWQMAVWSAATMAMCGVLSGCITVNAPSKPIVIELNINIKQEVVYRLAADAGKTIQNNKDIF